MEVDPKQLQIRKLIENYYDIQKIRIEAFNRVVGYVQVNFDKFKHIKTPEEKKYAYIAELICKEKIDVPEDLEDIVWLFSQLYSIEKQLYKRIDEFSKDHPFRMKYLNNIIGIGPIFASGIIAWLAPLSRFTTVSKLWKYCGLAPGMEMKKGRQTGYDPTLKAFLIRVGESFLMRKGRGSFYGKLYDKFRAECEQKHPDWNKKHIHYWARRKIVKVFLSHAWVMWWRLMEGQEPPTKPYAHAILKHYDYIEPVMDKLEKAKVRAV